MWQGVEDILKRDEPLAARTTFRIGGRADALLEPRSDEEFVAAWRAAREAGMPVLVLGGGSNLLIADDGVRSAVLCTRSMDGREPAWDGREATVSAGTLLRDLVKWTMRSGLAGLECLAGIPGTVGGAVRMNAGSRHGTIGKSVSAVTCIGVNGDLVRRPGAAVQWGYRRTDIRGPILSVALRLRRESSEVVRGRVRAILAEKARTQPLAQFSAGCFFKNPAEDSAGRIIEDAGLKGLAVGDACVSVKHANFIINSGKATAAEVLSLSGTVRERVRAHCGIVLENEVHCWPLTGEGKG